MLKTVQNTPSTERANKIDPRILLLSLGMFALGTDAFVVAGVLPVIAREMQVTEGLAGQLVTVFSLTYGLGAPVLAALTGRWSRNRVLMIALGAFCLSNIGSALAPTFSILMLTRILTGCFAALYAPLAYTTGTTLATPEKRGQALSFVLGGLVVATVLGSPLGTWVGEHFGWRLSFGLVALLAGVACAALVLCGLPRPVAAPALSLKARLAPMREPHLLLALSPTLLGNLGLYMVYTYLALLLQQNMHVIVVSGPLIVFGLGTASGNWVSGLAADRFGSNRCVVVGLTGLAVVLSALPLATTSLLAGLPALFIWGFLFPFLNLSQQHRLLSLAPEHANVILALNSSMLYLGIAGGAALGGLALHYVPVTQLSWLGVVCLLLALLMLTLSIRTCFKNYGQT
jgi:DHA1 family inner membrane transport protein